LGWLRKLVVDRAKPGPAVVIRGEVAADPPGMTK
jgi:hypothetical protein